MTEGVVKMLFPIDRAAALAGISALTARRWIRSGILRIEHGDVGLLAFRDLVALRTLAILSIEHHVPVGGRSGLRAFARWLYAHYREPWSSLRFHVSGREVIVDDGTGEVLVTNHPPGQTVSRPIVSIDMKRIEAAVQRDARQANARAPEQIGTVDKRRRIIAGTRIPTSAIRALHDANLTMKQILREYPGIREADVEAALRFERGPRRAA